MSPMTHLEKPLKVHDSQPEWQQMQDICHDLVSLKSYLLLIIYQ